ncbi:MAG: hypothetical protein Q8M11_13945 [Sulfuritalea sp.]|nr:hypothetical protein [Sulfuritalea sp.]MDP1984801.1 hypothetical protein [Sulfuritalea sp.]
MKITASLNEKIIRAVRLSMQLEGYQSSRSPAIKTQAKALMEQNGIHVMVKARSIASEAALNQEEGNT